MDKFDLKPFARRVRFLRTWRGAALGAAAGGIAASVWAGADYMGLADAEPTGLAVIIGVATVVGGLAGALRKISQNDLGASIDRRGKLEDRLSTAIDDARSASQMDADLAADASAKLSALQPKRLYPVRVGKPQYAALAAISLATFIFVAGNTPYFLTPEQKVAREEIKRTGEKVERLRKEFEESPRLGKELSAEERRIAEALRKLERDLDRAKMTPEEAIKRSQEIAEQADKLARESAKEQLKSLDSARDALAKSLMDQAKKQQGMEALAKEQMDALASKAAESPEAAQEALSELNQQVKDLQSQLDQMQKRADALKEKLNDPSLSDSERQKLSKELEDLLKKQEQANKDLEQLKLSQKAMETFAKLMQKLAEDPRYKKLMEMQQKLQESGEAAEQTGQPTLSKEEREEMMRQMEELAKELQSDEAMQAYIDELLNAMECAGGT